MKGKVFGVGMFKTGTNSFGKAMEMLGLTSGCGFWPLLKNLPAYFDLNPRQFLPFETAIRRKADRYDSFADAPWLYLYRELDRWYPDSRFVLTLRKDSTDLVESELKMWRRLGIMERWQVQVGSEPTREMFIERYERHSDNVIRHFRGRPHQLLEICWEEEADPWKRLCEFLKVEAPNRAFPHENQAPSHDSVA